MLKFYCNIILKKTFSIVMLKNRNPNHHITRICCTVPVLEPTTSTPSYVSPWGEDMTVEIDDRIAGGSLSLEGQKVSCLLQLLQNHSRQYYEVDVNKSSFCFFLSPFCCCCSDRRSVCQHFQSLDNPVSFRG